MRIMLIGHRGMGYLRCSVHSERLYWRIGGETRGRDGRGDEGSGQGGRRWMANSCVGCLVYWSKHGTTRRWVVGYGIRRSSSSSKQRRGNRESRLYLRSSVSIRADSVVDIRALAVQQD